jgi:hypothetical protein
MRMKYINFRSMNHMYGREREVFRIKLELQDTISLKMQLQQITHQ